MTGRRNIREIWQGEAALRGRTQTAAQDAVKLCQDFGSDLEAADTSAHASTIV